MNRLIITVLLLGFVACQSNSKKQSKKEAKTEVVIKGEAQGTTYTIKYIAENYQGLKVEVDSLLAAIDTSMSTYLPSSTISKLNDGDTVTIDSMFNTVFSLSQEVNQLMNGAFDPTIGPLIKAWGWDFSEAENMDSAKVQYLLKSSGFKHFELLGNKMWKKDTLARINFNAIAQGYSVDIMAKLLDKREIENYYVELGGELKVKGKNKFDEWWVIGIDSPDGENLERVLNTRVSLKNKAMVTSGNYRKFYEVDGVKYSHTIDPKSGYPSRNKILSATVIANNAALADALATAFMVIGVENSKEFCKLHPEIGVHLIYNNKNGVFENYTSEEVKKFFLVN